MENDIQLKRQGGNVEKLSKNHLMIIGGLIIGIILLGGYFTFERNREKEYEIESLNEVEGESTKKVEEEKEIIIHIAGNVKNEGIVNVKENARIADIIESAGGLEEDTDLSKINLAHIVQDGQKIYIPKIGEEEIENISGSITGNILQSSEEQNNLYVNINTATVAELETLSGIGPSTANKIIEYRKSNGRFQNIEDIKNVSRNRGSKI